MNSTTFSAGREVGTLRSRRDIRPSPTGGRSTAWLDGGRYQRCFGGGTSERDGIAVGEMVRRVE